MKHPATTGSSLHWKRRVLCRWSPCLGTFEGWKAVESGKGVPIWRVDAGQIPHFQTGWVTGDYLRFKKSKQSCPRPDGGWREKGGAVLRRVDACVKLELSLAEKEFFSLLLLHQLTVLCFSHCLMEVNISWVDAIELTVKDKSGWI